MKQKHKLKFWRKLLSNSLKGTKWLTIFMFFSSCHQSEEKLINNTDRVPLVSTIMPSLVNQDHTSEGFLVTLKDGTIIHIYRQDNSISGGHTGNTGGIYKRCSFNDGKTWTEPEKIFKDEYDDRNIRGGITEEGYIIVFFRRYEANTCTSIDLNYVISTDAGKSFSPRHKLILDINPNLYEVWIDNFAKISRNQYLLPVHGVGYCEMRTFHITKSLIQFDNDKWKWDETITMPLGIDEPYICVKENKVICLFRDERSQNRSNYYQATSSDFGKTWTNPVKTNIAYSYFCPSPLIFIEPNSKKDVFVVATDRRTPDAVNSKIWIYNSSFEQIFQNPNSHIELKTINRPNPNEYVFYGYPIATKMKNGNWLIIITESHEDSINEDTDFYQFEISI